MQPAHMLSLRVQGPGGDGTRKYLFFKPLPTRSSSLSQEDRARLVSYGRLGRLMESSSMKLIKLPLEERGRPLVATVLFIDLGFGKGFDI